MGFTYPNKFTHLNIFVMELAQRCSDNGGSTVLIYVLTRKTDPCKVEIESPAASKVLPCTHK